MRTTGCQKDFASPTRFSSETDCPREATDATSCNRQRIVDRDDGLPIGDGTLDGM